MKSKLKSRGKQLLLSLLGGVLASVVASFVFYLMQKQEGRPIFDVLIDFFSALLNFNELWIRGLLITLLRFLAGFAIALCLGVILGLGMGRFEAIERIFKVLVNVLRPIPSAAVIPLAMIIFPLTGNPIKIFIIAYGALWPMLYSVYKGAQDIDAMLVDTGRTLGKSEKDIFIDIVFPATLPAIMTGARVGLGIGLLLAVTAEMLSMGDQTGIGYLIIDYERSFKFPAMFAAVILLGIVGWVLDIIFGWLEDKILYWHPRTQRGKTLLLGVEDSNAN
jgi:NitT/TauT family transport system permease protein